MVQMFYYESQSGNRGLRNIWKRHGNRLKVNLHLDDSWADTTAAQSFLLVKKSRWKRDKVSVVEVNGTRSLKGEGKISSHPSNSGAIVIQAVVKQNDKINSQMQHLLKLKLTNTVSEDDFNMGYCLSGTVERALIRPHTGIPSVFKTTHLAFVKRLGLQPDQHQQPKESRFSNNNNEIEEEDEDMIVLRTPDEPKSFSEIVFNLASNPVESLNGFIRKTRNSSNNRTENNQSSRRSQSREPSLADKFFRRMFQFYRTL